MKKIINESNGSLYNNPDVSDDLYNDSLTVFRVISSDGDVKLIRAKNKFDAELMSGFDDVLDVESANEVTEDLEEDEDKIQYKLFAYNEDGYLISSDDLEETTDVWYDDKGYAIDHMQSLMERGLYSKLILKAFYPDGRAEVVHEEEYRGDSIDLPGFDENGVIQLDLDEKLFIEESRQLNYDDDLIRVTLNDREVYTGIAEDWIGYSFYDDFVWKPTKGYYEAHNDRGTWIVKVIDVDSLNESAPPIERSNEGRGDFLIDLTAIDPKASSVIGSVLGQLSDGIWENSSRMEPYWKHMRIKTEGGHDYLVIDEFGSPLSYMNDEELFKWLATKIKQIVKIEIEDGSNAKWDRNDTTPLDYMHDGLTVRDAYKVYDALLGRKNRIVETYSDDELEDLKNKVFNTQKIENIYRRKKYGEPQLWARTKCIKCGREKRVFLSNLVSDPEKYGSCICSDNYIDSKIDNISKLYSNKKRLSSNTSGYTGVSFVKSYGGEPYNKWRAYIEIGGKRNYLGDFDSKTEAVRARKEAGEKGIKWYRENRGKLIKDVRKRTKKTDKSKYKDTTTKVSVLKKDEKDKEN